MSIEPKLSHVQLENISTPIYVECYKMYRSKICIQEFWFIVSDVDIQPEQSQNDNPACKKKKAVPGCEIDRVIYNFFHSIATTLWLSGWGESKWVGRHVFDSRKIRKLSAVLRHFAWHWARQWIDTCAFILLCSLYFFFLGFLQWRSRAERVLTLNMNIRLLLFWSIWKLARGLCAGRLRSTQLPEPNCGQPTP